MEQETYLSHHGVPGMKWGVRNAETLARYNRKHPTGRKVYGPELTLKKGSELFRITNAKEAKKTFDPDRPTYAVGSARDYVRYGTVAKYLPSMMYRVSPIQKIKGPQTMRFTAKKDMKIASGEATQNYVISNFGNMTMAELNNKVKAGLHDDGMSYFARHYGMSPRSMDKFISKHANEKVRNVDKKLSKTRGKKAQSRRNLVAVSTAGATVGSFGTLKQRDQFINDFKRRKYDAVIDPEDYKSPSVGPKFSRDTNTVNETAMIIIRPRESVTLEEVYKTFGSNDKYLPTYKDKSGKTKAGKKFQ